jgi:uncharacterized damage-inducible protein DinB
MTDPTTDVTLDRLLRHMGWANATLIGWLSGVSDDALAFAAPRNEWHVARILDHLINSAGGYANRLEGNPRAQVPELLTSVSQLAERAARCAEFDARLRAQAALPDGLASYAGDTDNAHARSTVLSQAIHHATEHRAQIAGALATNGIDVIDLDAIDLWAYAEAEAAAS